MFVEIEVTPSRITKSSKNKYQKNFYQYTKCLDFFHFTIGCGKNKGLKESLQNEHVFSWSVKSLNQGLHAFSCIDFVSFGYFAIFVHIAILKSSVFTSDQAEHCFVKISIMLL